MRFCKLLGVLFLTASCSRLEKLYSAQKGKFDSEIQVVNNVGDMRTLLHNLDISQYEPSENDDKEFNFDLGSYTRANINNIKLWIKSLKRSGDLKELLSVDNQIPIIISNTAKPVLPLGAIMVIFSHSSGGEKLLLEQYWDYLKEELESHAGFSQDLIQLCGSINEEGSLFWLAAKYKYGKIFLDVAKNKMLTSLVSDLTEDPIDTSSLKELLEIVPKKSITMSMSLTEFLTVGDRSILEICCENSTLYELAFEILKIVAQSDPQLKRDAFYKVVATDKRYDGQSLVEKAVLVDGTDMTKLILGSLGEVYKEDLVTRVVIRMLAQSIGRERSLVERCKGNAEMIRYLTGQLWIECRLDGSKAGYAKVHRSLLALGKQMKAQQQITDRRLKEAEAMDDLW